MNLVLLKKRMMKRRKKFRKADREIADLVKINRLDPSHGLSEFDDEEQETPVHQGGEQRERARRRSSVHSHKKRKSQLHHNHGHRHRNSHLVIEEESKIPTHRHGYGI